MNRGNDSTLRLQLTAEETRALQALLAAARRRRLNTLWLVLLLAPLLALAALGWVEALFG
jgi:hypothetical protein